MKHALVVGVVAMAACDPLATGSFAPAYLTIAGSIDGSTATVMPTDVRVALVWQSDLTGTTNYAVQLADVLAQFPADFSVNVRQDPPATVIDSLPADTPPSTEYDPAMRWAVAALVVYADGDGNRELTITGPNDPPSPDVVLAATTDLDIFLLAAGKPAAADLVGIFPVTSGFSIVQEPPYRDPKPGECGRFTAEGHYSDLCQPVQDTLPQLLDPSAFVEHVTLADDPRLQGYSCSTYWGALDYADFLLAQPGDICDGGSCRFCRGYQCPLDLPAAGDALTCAPDGTSYVYKHCVENAALCGTRFCHYGHGERMAADPPPSGWPCP